MNRKWMLVAFCGLMVLSALFSALRRQERQSTNPVPISITERGFSPRQLPRTGSNPARTFGTAIADAVEKVMPCVVVIRTEAIQFKLKQDFFKLLMVVQFF